jgi:hypothetical protein
MDAILAAHEPCPALAVDRQWNLIAANRAVAPLLEGVAENLLAGPVNVMRLALHPEGLAPRIANLAEWRAHLIGRLRREIELTADAGLEPLWPSSRRIPPRRPATGGRSTSGASRCRCSSSRPTACCR